MKYVKYCIMFMIGMGILPLVTHAECSYERQAELSRIAGNVQFNYEYDLNQELMIETTISNVMPDIVVVDNESTVFTNFESKKRYYGGETIRYDIYSKDTSCGTDSLLTKYVNLPTFNQFSLLDECIKYPDFGYCQMWGDFGISYETFKKELSKYEKKLEANNKTKNEGEKFSLMVFFEENKVMIILMLIVLVMLIGLFILKTKKELR